MVEELAEPDLRRLRGREVSGDEVGDEDEGEGVAGDDEFAVGGRGRD